MKSAVHTFDYLVFIGRFQPFHKGHESVVQHALKLCRTLVILIGSAERPRSIKDPWTVQERINMIERSLSYHDKEKLLFGNVHDTLYNDEAWARSVQEEVKRLTHTAHADTIPLSKHSATIGIIGHEKDSSSYYLSMFPQWERIDTPNHDGLSATAIRHLYFKDTQPAYHHIQSHIPSPIEEWMQTFAHTPEWQQLQREYAFIETYKKSWEAAPYAPVFVTTDAIIVHSGHVLMIRRRAEPGKGLWAWPGGFVGQDETLLDACIRELREETRLKIPAPVLKGSIKNQRVFDHPTRSMRGRTITHAFLFEFPTGELPVVKGGDDADKARWISLADFFTMRSQLFEDHFDIGAFFLGSN
ncbi:MAG: bifunctional nicotinamide-nucleotide adenylyltransferase/Nudix hydroxylase [Pseudomonadota bacterium]